MAIADGFIVVEQTLAARRTDGHSLACTEQLVLDNGLVDLQINQLIYK